MQSSLGLAIREHLADYVDGEASLLDFKDWLVGATWDVDESGEPEAIDLTYEIKLLLAEQSSEGWPETELRDLLRPLARFKGVAAKS